jgi:hypothetical protein
LFLSLIKCISVEFFQMHFDSLASKFFVPFKFSNIDWGRMGEKER